jgi:hypothetical protein
MTVSTVLRPVGPQPPRVYWLRRGILLGVIVLVIVIVLVVLSGGGSGTPGPAHHSPPPSTPATTPATTQVAACDPSDLTLVLSTDSDTYTSGQTPKLLGVFSNSSSTTCTISTDPAGMLWTITSGSDKIWTTKGCPASTPAKTLKVKAGHSRTVSTTWDGRRLESGCTAGSAALPGEYVLNATLDGVKGTPAVFHITS